MITLHANVKATAEQIRELQVFEGYAIAGFHLEAIYRYSFEAPGTDDWGYACVALEGAFVRDCARRLECGGRVDFLRALNEQVVQLQCRVGALKGKPEMAWSTQADSLQFYWRTLHVDGDDDE